MKQLALFYLMFNAVIASYSQSKKDLEEKILQLEEKTKNLESEITGIKTNLTNTATTLTLVSKSNLDLEKQVNAQNTMIQKLIKQNDSLLIVFKIKNEAHFISTPRNEEDSIIFVVQSYFAAKKWEDRLAYVLKPDQIKQQMKDYYSDYRGASTVKKNEIFIKGTAFKPNESFRVHVNNIVMYFKKVNNDYKIDWLATVGYNVMPMNTFKANLSPVATEMRVNAKLGNYFNFNYIEAQSTHWNIDINDVAYNGIVGCYISKKSAEGKKLYDLLKDGKTHPIIVEVVIDSSQDNSGNTAVITKLVTEGWSKE